MRRFGLFCLCLLFFAPTVSANSEWTELKSRHFLIYYKSAPTEFVDSVEESAEEYYDEILIGLGFRRYEGWTWDNRAKIYIYDDYDDYVNNAKQFGWSAGTASPGRKIIKTFPAAHGFFDSTLPHELGHIVFREFIGQYVRVPLWLEEGVAMYQEKAKRWGAHKSVRLAMEKGTFLSVEELGKMRLTHQTSREEITLFYNEAASIVNYLISERGEHRFARFCRYLRDKRSFLKALKSAYPRFRRLDDLNRAWTNYLKQ